MFQSINDARYTMWATVIPRLDTLSVSTGGQPGAGQSGYFKRDQDPDSGQITTVWVPNQSDPSTGREVSAQFDVRCYARGYTNLGFRSSANREIYVKGEYNINESIQFDFPLTVVINNQSLVTNIRGTKDGTDFFWLYEDTVRPVVWEVQGITPVTDPFGKALRYTTVLKRSEVQ